MLFNDIFIYFVVAVFPLFGASKNFGAFTKTAIP